MVAHRGRFAAVALAVLLLSSALAVVAPTAAAQTGPTGAQAFDATFSNPSVTVDRAGQSFPYSASLAPLKPGDIVRFRWNVQWTAACGAPPINPVVSLTSTTVDATRLGVAGTPNAERAVAGTTAAIFYNATVATQTGANATNNDADVFVALRYTMTCSTIPEGTESGWEPSPLFRADTQAPTISGVSLTPPSGTRKIGDTITITGAASESTLLWDLSALNGSTSEFVPMGGVGTYTIADSNVAAANGIKPARLNGVAANVVLKVSDTAGNAVTQNVAVTVDNVRPETSPTLGTSKLERTQLAPGSDLFLNTVTLDYATTTAATHVFLGGVKQANGVTSLQFTNAHDEVPSIALMPVDAAGNTNESRNVTLLFPTANVSYGLASSTDRRPAYLADGDDMGRLFVNITGRAAIGNWDLTATKEGGPLNFTLARETVAGLRYWKNGTNGGSETDFVNARSDTATSPPSTTWTLFQPARDVAPAPVSGKISLSLTNLTTVGSATRDLLDGAYRLETRVLGSEGGQSNALVQTYLFRVDSQAPQSSNARNYTAPSKGPVQAAGVVHGWDGNPVRVLVNVTDWRQDRDFGIKNITVELVETATLAPVTRANGQLAQVQITPESCGAADGLPHCKKLMPPADPSACSLGTAPESLACYQQRYNSGNWSFTHVNGTSSGLWTSFQGWVNVTFPDLPVGSYKIRVAMTDIAGRQSGEVFADTYTVAPNARIESTATSPFLNAEGRIDFEVLASQRLAAPPAEMAGSCVGGVCPPDYVETYITNDPNAAIGASTVKPYQNMTFGRAGALKTVATPGYSDAARLATNGSLSLTTNDIPYLIFTPNQPPVVSSISGINAANTLYLKARAVRVMPGGGSLIVNTTDWVRVATASTPSLAINQPPAEWPFAIFGETSNKDRIPYNVSFRLADGSTPELRTTIVSESGTTYTFPAAAPLNSGNNAPKVDFNWTGMFTQPGGAPLPAGSYRFHAEAWAGTSKLAEADRNFTILAVKPTVKVEPADQLPSAGVYVAPNGALYARPTFDLAFYVNHGAANLTSPDQLEFTLSRDIPRGSTKALLKNGEEGFSVVVRPGSVLTDAESISYFNATVTLPTTAVNNDTFHLNITAELDVAPYRIGNFSAVPKIYIDTQPPAGYADAALSAASVLGCSGCQVNGNAPVFWGFVEDQGSGVKRVEVRIIDTAQNRTLVASGDNIDLASGEADYWMTNETVLASSTVHGPHQLRNAFVYPAGSGRYYWTVNTTDRKILVDGVEQPGKFAQNMPINLNTTYRVDVRTVDNVGQITTAFNTTRVLFDPLLPRLGVNGQLNTTTNHKGGIIASTAVVPWHGSAVLRVNATDNNCLKAVRLVGVSDANPNVTVRANMSPLDDVCGKGKDIRWQIDLANAAHMTNDVSNYTYWFEAEDTAGRVNETPAAFRTFRMRVTDATPAAVESVLLVPPTVGEGSRSRVEAYVVENQAIMNVTVAAHYANNNTRITTVQMQPDPARPVSPTGTGWYVADTSDDIGLELALGSYTFYVTARDVNYNSTCGGFCTPGSGILIVTADAPPQIIQDAPARGATYVGAQPTLKYTVLDRFVSASNVKVEVGNGTSLATVNATLTEIKTSNGTRQGYAIAYTPTTAFADGDNLTVRITATSSKGFSNVTTFNYLVDALPPVVSANVTGLQTVANQTWAVGATRVALTAVENETGPATIRYVVGTGAEQTYSEPLAPSGNDGAWRLEYWAVDGAGNAAPRQSLNLTLDRSGPRIDVANHSDNPIVTVSDGANGVGLDETNVTIHYAYGDAIAYTAKKMEKLTGNSFTVALPGKASETGLRYWFDAKDLLGNTGTNFSATVPHVIKKAGGTLPPPEENQPPTVAITFPTGNPTAGPTLEVRWVAEDPEGEPVSITIALAEPEPQTLVIGADNSGSYTLNMSGRAPGSYKIVLTASDGEETAQANATFTIAAGPAVSVKTPPPSTVEPGEPVSFALSIDAPGKTVAAATYSLVRDGKVAGSGPLRASDGAYAATVNPTEPGAYRIVVSVAYADGTSEPARSVAAFTVAGEPTKQETSNAFPVSLMAVVLLALVVVGLGAYGAFGRWKK